jgi:serpin B
MLRGLDAGVEFRIANSIWTDDGFPVEPAFLATTRQFFDARVESLDFASPSSLATINGWVNEATAGKIPTILDEIRPDELMFLINAIYFKGSWRERFDPARTRDDQFTTRAGGRVTVKMMSREGKVRLGATADAQVADLGYGGDAFAMTIVLPNEGRNVDELIAGMTPERWTQLVSQLAERERIPVSLPRFRIEWSAELNEHLKALGVRHAFSETTSDFSRLSPMGRQPGGLVITRVKQKTFVDVNEEGTEAAAATSVGIGPTSAPLPFRVDRPFLFAIRERLSGTILFVGKIVDPTK